MKNKTLWMLCFLIINSISCKDKLEPKPTANINDILGTWVSVDSSLVQLGKDYSYIHDTLTFRNDTIISLFGTTSPYMLRIGINGLSVYSFDYFIPDSIKLSYAGPEKIGFVINNFRHKVQFNKDKDLMSLIDFRYTYPSCPFNKFYKIN